MKTLHTFEKINQHETLIKVDIEIKGILSWFWGIKVGKNTQLDLNNQQTNLLKGEDNLNPEILLSRSLKHLHKKLHTSNITNSQPFIFHFLSNLTPFFMSSSIIAISSSKSETSSATLFLNSTILFLTSTK